MINFLPPASIWNKYFKILITEDKPIMLDYWTEIKKVLIPGKKENKKKNF